MYPLLNKIDSPSDLKKLELEQLPQVCSELRDYLLNTISQTSGHLASNLGAVELTVAIHYVYQTPFDQLIWDVGHQAYPHKILTGRRDALKSIRKKNGLHPFPWREESPYDSLSVGHSSTSISAGLGMAIAAKRENLNRKIVSVIGDGAITAGLAFEALNHAGDVRPDMLVILNDNDMSISENVGALSKHMAQILSGEFYTNIRECSKKMLANTPTLKDIAQKTEEHLKGMIGPGTLFEELGFNYIGPIDGHDVILLVKTLTNMRNNLTGPQFLHISTTKGKGYSPAELDPTSYHGVPKFNLHTNSLPKSCSKYPTYSQVFGQWLVDMATVDPSLVAITPAMREGSGMVEFSKRYPDRFFDVAIAEQHAVTIATGLAIGGLKPVIAIYSSFLQRAYDQVIHDIALMNLSVLFAIDRAGIVGADGPTHQGAFDISFLRCIPNLIIMTPSDENECRQMLYTGHQYHGPACVRYPRGSGACCTIEHTFTQFEIGVANKIKSGSSIAILNFGSRLKSAKIAAKNLNATLVDMRFVKPLDKTMILELATSHKYLVTIEENAIMGGAGSGVNELLMAHKVLVPVLNLGLPDEFIAQGGQEEINRDCNLDAYGIETEITNYIGQ